MWEVSNTSKMPIYTIRLMLIAKGLKRFGMEKVWLFVWSLCVGKSDNIERLRFKVDVCDIFFEFN